ncbi:MAG: thermonuclease family protein [Spirochaetes bacterium]|nr:thermonuclease family protein [Spirochaetota bacterium]
MRGLNRKFGVIALFLIPVFVVLGQAAPTETVYVTNTGRVYHLDGCASLARSQIAVALIDAVRSGFNPCSRCRPPVLGANVSDFPHDYVPLYRVNLAGRNDCSEAAFAQMLPAVVIGHIDGDTVRVRIPNPPPGLSVIEVVRLLGVDAPETVHPNRPAEHFGQETSDFVRQELLGRTVRLAFDWDLRDRFGRLLAYIYTEQGRSFNARLVYEGYAEALLAFRFQFMDEFRTLETEARRLERGLWAR